MIQTNALRPGYFVLILVLLGISGCKKDVSPDPKNEVPNNHPHTNVATITITLPIADMVYNQGDTIRLSGMARGTETLHGWEIFLRNTTSGDSIIYNKSDHVHDTLITFSETWINHVTEESEIELEVCVGLNHGGDKSCRTVMFKAKL